MAVAGKQIRMKGTAVMVLALAVMTVQDLPGGEPDTRDPFELMELIAQIESGEAEDQAQAVAEDPALVPMATPCNMRRPRMALGVDQAWRHRFAAATIATDPALRVGILEDLLGSAPDEMSRWRIDVALVENAIRHDEPEVARAMLQRAATRDVDATCRADEAYYAAAIAGTAPQVAALLARAIEADPGFWAAHEQLALVSAEGTGADPATCEADAVRALYSVVQLAALARRDTQFQRINRAIEALPVNGRTSLLRGMILHQTGEIQAARQAYEMGLETLGASACDAILRQGLDGVLATLEVGE